MSARIFTILLLLVLVSSASLSIIRDFVQYNIAGVPVVHKVQHWPFDPESGRRRSRQYQELNGRYGQKAIERLGLGTDGKDEERLQRQRARDEALLRGAH